MEKQEIDATRRKAQRFYEKACALVKGELVFHENQGRTAPNLWVSFKLRRATGLFQKVIRLVPRHWNSMWLLGKTVQRLGDEQTAFEWFVKAWDLEPKNADVAREASLSAMNLGLGRHAIEYSEEALKVEPNEAGLMCNLGLAYLHDGQPEKALEIVQHAKVLDGNDKVNENVLRLIQHIISNKSACPQNRAEMDAYCLKHRDAFR
jgi:Flp pilus assembly protein TadD